MDLSLGSFGDRRLEKGGRRCCRAWLRARASACVVRPQSASVAFTTDEIAALHAIETKQYAPRTEKQRNPHPKDTLAWAAWIIARLGGWDGYSSSKPPGPVTFKHGLDYFHGIAMGWRL